MPLSRIFARFNRRVANPVIRLFAGRLPPFSIVHHRGRVTADAYTTPVWSFRTEDGLVFAVLYGSRSDWVKNVLASGDLQVKRLGRVRDYGRPRLIARAESDSLVPAFFRVVFRLLRVRELLRVTDSSRIEASDPTRRSTEGVTRGDASHADGDRRGDRLAGAGGQPRPDPV